MVCNAAVYQGIGIETSNQVIKSKLPIIDDKEVILCIESQNRVIENGFSRL